MFLTTNRVRRFDEAFHSRISIALAYEPLDVVSRKQVWANLLTHAQLDASSLDVDKLATYDINGRQIKNVIRLSQTVIKDKHLSLTTDLVESNIKLTSAFLSDVDNKDNDVASTNNTSVKNKNV